jgi:hypothetical protein
MSSKADYSTEEWGNVISGPYFAALYIVVADFNLTYFKELAAMTKAVIDSAAKTTSDLIKAVAVDLTSKDSQDQIKLNMDELRGQKDPSGMKADVVAMVSRAADTVADKSAEDSDEYRRWLLHLAQVTAEASKEGGFLGFGAVRVSDREMQGLEELAQALGVDQAT